MSVMGGQGVIGLIPVHSPSIELFIKSKGFVLPTVVHAYGIALLNRSVAVDPKFGGKGVVGGYVGGGGVVYGRRGEIVDKVPMEF